MASVNKELLDSFISEVEGYLKDIDLYLSRQLEDSAFVEGRFPIYESVHNTKGAASMVKNQALAQCASMFQRYLDEAMMEDGLRMADVFQPIDQFSYAIRKMLDNLRADKEAENAVILETLCKDLGLEATVAPTAGTTTNEGQSDPLLEGFLAESRELIAGLEGMVGRFSKTPDDPEIQEELLTCLSTLRDGAAMVQLKSLQTLSQKLIHLLQGIQDNSLPSEGSVTDLFGLAQATMKDILAAVENKEDDGQAAISNFKSLAKMFLTHEQFVLLFEDGREEKQGTGASAQEHETSQSSFLSGSQSPSVKDEYLEQLRDLFREEGREHIQDLSQHLLDLEQDKTGYEVWKRIYRTMHTLKGAAATVGFTVLSSVAHRVEDLADEVTQGKRPADEPVLDFLYGVKNLLEPLLEFHGEDMGQLERIKQEFDRMLEDLSRSPAGRGSSEFVQSKAVAKPDKALSTVSLESPSSQALVQRSIKVRMDRLDGLMNHVWELRNNQSHISEQAAIMSNLAKKLRKERKNLSQTVNNFLRRHQWELPNSLSRGMGGHGGFSELEFDTYGEMAVFSRTLEEIDFRVASYIKYVENLLLDFSESNHQLGKLIQTLQDDMIDARMVPVEDLFRYLSYQTADLARRFKKRVTVRMDTSGTEIDKAISDQIGESMMHLIRNSITHGVESPEERREAGKDEQAEIRLRSYQDEQHVVLEISDDGRGINVDRLRDVAVERGLFTPEDVATKSDDEVIGFIFYPQFSTKKDIDDVSGRGVGMEVVLHHVSSLFGSINVESERGKGTRFIIKLPLTLAIQNVIQVKVSGHDLMLPMSYVDTILEPDTVDALLDDQFMVSWKGQPIPIRELSGFLNLNRDSDYNQVAKNKPVVVLRSGTKWLGLWVDNVVGHEDIVIRPLPGVLVDAVQYIGVTITRSGTAQLVLNVPALFEIQAEMPVVSTPRQVRDSRVKVMIADDSLSIRKAIQGMLEDHNFETITAKDGMIAWQKLHATEPDLLLVDLEMPGLNGYELMERIRNTPDFNALPMIVLTSRGGRKHREMAMKSGANEFLTKPVLEKKLLEAIMAFLPPSLKNQVLGEVN